jgi:murein DD-endopeptidase MepM/ murein hydrolase activator NlpD
MMELPDTNDVAGACALCNGPLGDGRYLWLAGSAFSSYCSRVCFDEARKQRRTEARALRWRQARWVGLGLLFLAACLTPHQWLLPRPRPVPAAPRIAHTAKPALPPGWFGPEWPPSETSVLAALGRDSWIHPLAGPVRRMPLRESRVFGAVRPGNRPIDCRNGHCGVDLGGEIWGEHVYAVHDGVVDFVQRGANRDRGGAFVRLAHRDGTVFTQYFHLAAIAPGLSRGGIVKGGQVIGLLGDTGVKESEPHLHFTVSIRAYKDGPEKYIDPEPLIALWPLRVPIDGTEVGLVTTVARPAAPLGSAPLLARRLRKSARPKGPSAPAVDEGAPQDSDSAAPAPEESSAEEEGAADD